MKRFVAAMLGLLLVAAVPAASMAYGKANREAEMTRVMRSVLAQTKDPRQVAQLLSQHGARFAGYRENTVTFAHTGDAVVPLQSTVKAIGPDFKSSVTERKITTGITPMAGDKADLTLTMWLYEWRNGSGNYTEQAIINGNWSATEYRWIDDPTDVVDVRWIVGDLVYLSSAPYDGVQRDQHTQGIASFTVDDQVANWDLYVNFRPVSPAVYGRWTNVFVNYTHTWWGVRLGVSLGAGPTGSTGSITINTDAKTWTEGVGLAFEIGSEDLRGPVTSGDPVPQ